MKSNGQGQSFATIDKERRIGSGIAVGMRIASYRFAGRGFRYWHYDANCGSGENEKIGVAGSPIVFWQVAYDCLRGLDPAPYFCDIDENAIRRLQQRLNNDPEASSRSVLLHGDNSDGLDTFANAIRRSGENRKYVVGSVLVDPNGYIYRNRHGGGVSIEKLQEFAYEFPRIDIILNLNVRIYKLQAAHNHNVIHPQQLLRSLKLHWLLGRAYVGQARFVLAVGRNVKTKPHEALGLVHWDSLDGQEIMALFEKSLGRPPRRRSIAPRQKLIIPEEGNYDIP